MQPGRAPPAPFGATELKGMIDGDGELMQMIDSRVSDEPQFGRESTAAGGFGVMCFFLLMLALSAVVMANRKYKHYLRGERKKDRRVVQAQGSNGVVVSSSMGPMGMTKRKN